MPSLGFIGITIIFLLLIKIGLSMTTGFLSSLFPGIAPFLTHNTAAFTIFLLFNIFLRMPFIIGAIVAGIYGIIFFSPWYYPILQFLVLQLIWFVFNLIISLIFGAGSILVSKGR